MSALSRSRFLVPLLLCVPLGVSAQDPAEPPGGEKPTADAIKTWGSADLLVIANLDSVKAGPVGLSDPPVRTYRLTFTVDRALRGSAKKNEAINSNYSIRSQNEPVFKTGKPYIVGLTKSRGGLTVTAYKEATKDDLKQATLVAALPLGWTVQNGKLASPWASLGGKAWAGAVTGVKCEVSGRPALLAGPGVTLSVEHVPPPVEVKFGNPDGDGEYKITVKNTSDKAVSVPALVSDGKKVLWEESLAILSQGKVYPCPGAKGVAGEAKATTLKPGEEVSYVVHALKLQGPMWPRGGYRIEFQFALGELGVTKSFYYLSKHHDVIRDRVGGK